MTSPNESHEWLSNYKEVYTVKDANLVILGGGTDINAKLYDQYEDLKNDIPDKNRDYKEIKVIEMAKLHNIPILGICRGAQLLTVVSGGSLIQDVNNHNCKDHEIICNNKVIKVNSYHHQMMNPTNINSYLPLAFCKNKIATNITSNVIEYEIIYYKDLNALAVQFHPEYEETSHPSCKLVKDLLKKYCYDHNYSEQLTA